MGRPLKTVDRTAGYTDELARLQRFILRVTDDMRNNRRPKAWCESALTAAQKLVSLITEDLIDSAAGSHPPE